jgi:hypothetical protein
VVTTATGTGSGALSAPVNLNLPACVFQWEIYNSTAYMGGASSLLRISTGGIIPPVVPPRDR